MCLIIRAHVMGAVCPAIRQSLAVIFAERLCIALNAFMNEAKEVVA